MSSNSTPKTRECRFCKALTLLHGIGARCHSCKRQEVCCICQQLMPCTGKSDPSDDSDLFCPDCREQLETGGIYAPCKICLIARHRGISAFCSLCEDAHQTWRAEQERDRLRDLAHYLSSNFKSCDGFGEKLAESIHAFLDKK